MRELLSHPHAAPHPVAFSAPAPATARFNNSTEKYRPGISPPHAAPRPAAFSVSIPGIAHFNNVIEEYRRSPLYRRLMGGESHA